MFSYCASVEVIQSFHGSLNDGADGGCFSCRLLAALRLVSRCCCCCCWVPYFYGDFFPLPGDFFSRLSSRRLVCQGSKAASKQASRQAGRQASKQASQPASKQAGQQASKQASQPASQQASKQASKPTQQASQPASKQAREPASEQAGKQATKGAREQAREPASKQSFFEEFLSEPTEVVTSYWLYTPISIYTYALYFLA